MPLAFIGPWEALILIAIIVFLFGAKRFAAAGRSLVRGARELKAAIRQEERTESRSDADERA